MPAVLFHQNMRTFGGGSQPRMNAYLGVRPPRRELPATWPGLVCPANGSFGFPAIATTLARAIGAPAQTLCAVGLTELTNQTTARGSAATLSRELMQGGHGRVHMFNCGATALRGPEYAAITLPGWVNLIALGRIATGGELNYINEVTTNPAEAEWWSTLPEGSSADWRFVVYAVIATPDLPRFAVGFIHNTYTLESKTSADLRMPWLAQQIYHSTDPPPTHIYIGGDFNVEPHRPGTRLPMYPYFVGTEANTERPFQLIDGRLGGTTWHGSLYDYWLSDVDWDSREAPQPLISCATWDGPRGLMSDHVATLLQIA